MLTDEQIAYARKQIAEQLPYFPPPKHIYDRGEDNSPIIKAEAKKAKKERKPRRPRNRKRSFTVEP